MTARNESHRATLIAMQDAPLAAQAAALGLTVARIKKLRRELLASGDIQRQTTYKRVLTPQQRHAIATAYLRGTATQQELANAYGVTQKAVSYYVASETARREGRQ